MIIHVQASSFTPDFSAFRDFIQTFNEGFIGLVKVRWGQAASMLKLDQGRPETTSCIVDLERRINKLFSLSKEAIPELKHHSFEVNFPFRLH